MGEETPGPAETFDSFDGLVAAYEKRIFNVVYRYLGDYDEAADVTQETFINAYRHFNRFRGDARVFTWLYQIAVNQCRNRVRQRDRAQQHHAESLDQPRLRSSAGGETAREVADLTHAPQTILEAREMQRLIASAVQSLPPEYREVVLLRDMQGLSYNDIAQVSGLTLDNVKTRLSRARAMLRRKLEPYIRGG